MIVSEIQNEILLRLGAGARTTASQLINAIDEGNKRIYSQMVQTHERLFYTNTTFNAILNRQEYTPSDGVPTDIKRILKLETRYAGQTDRVKCTKTDLVNIDQMDKVSTTYKSREHPNYYWFGNGATTVIGFVPTHDESGDNYNKIWYLRRATRLTLGTQTPIVPEDAHFLIVQFGVTVAQLIEDEDANAYLAFGNKFDADVRAWMESEYPGDTDPKFTQDVEEDVTI